MEFNDRRRRATTARPRTKAEVNGHLINDHEYTAGGAGNSTRNLPTADELHAQHDALHAHGSHGGHQHLPAASPVRTQGDLNDHIHGPAHPEVVEASDYSRTYLKMLHDSLHEHPDVSHEHRSG